MERWYEKALEELDQDYEEGLITSKEYQTAMRELNEEYRAQAEEAAEIARDSFYW